VLPLRRPYLEHHEHAVDDAFPRGNANGVVESGEEIYYQVTLRNTGQDRATGVAGTLRALDRATGLPHSLVTVGDGSASFGTIEPGAEAVGDRFEFTLDGGADPTTVLLELTLDDDLGPVRVEFLDVVPPVETAEVIVFGAPTSIRLEWDPSASGDTKGYDIYRSSNPGGPFVRINDYTVDGTSAYEDLGLPSLTRYYYQIVARDSSMNAADPSRVVSGTTNPPFTPGWPNELGQQAQSSAVISNTAGGSDNEIFAAADYVYGWHADGTEILDGDNDPRTNGPYAPEGYDEVKGFAATTAIGDLDDDDDLEIVNVTWDDSVFVWDHEGNLVPGWGKSLLDGFNWPSPVLYDLDSDNDLEIIVWAGNGGRLFAWHHDGVEVADGDQNPATDGVLFRVFGTSFNYSSPAVADVDDDLRPEIIFCINRSDDDSGKIYVLNHDGTVADGWPFATGSTGTPSQITASPAVGDIDFNGTQEIVVAASRGGGRLYVFNGDGTVRAGWPRAVAAASAQGRVSSPVLADINGDTFLDVIFAASDGKLWAFDRDGSTISGFPLTYATGLAEATQATPAVADIDDDLRFEIVLGDETGRLHAFNHDGSLVDGFPIQLNGEVRSTPVLWDIDNDTMVEVALVGWDANVYMWDLPSEFFPNRVPWPFFRHDVRNTGWIVTAPLAVGVPAEGPWPSAPAFARVHPPRPNPFNPSTTIDFEVPGEGARPVSIAVYDVSGRLVRNLLAGPVTAGRHTVQWDGRGMNGRVLGTGTYFVRVEIAEHEFIEKVTLIK
jgi:hypothetical protein